MTPYQSERFIAVLHGRGWRIPTATLLREFGEPDLVSRAAPSREWFYVVRPHIVVQTGLPRSDHAHRVEIAGPQARFGGCNRLAMWFYEAHGNKPMTWWRILRPWLAAPVRTSGPRTVAISP